MNNFSKKKSAISSAYALVAVMLLARFATLNAQDDRDDSHGTPMWQLRAQQNMVRAPLCIATGFFVTTWLGFASKIIAGNDVSSFDTLELVGVSALVVYNVRCLNARYRDLQQKIDGLTPIPIPISDSAVHAAERTLKQDVKDLLLGIATSSVLHPSLKIYLDYGQCTTHDIVAPAMIGGAASLVLRLMR